MKIVLYTLNFSPEMTGVGKYSGELSSWLVENGHDVEVVTSPPYYPEWKIHSHYSNTFQKTITDGLTVIRCPLYIPTGKLTVFKRVLHLASFALSSFFSIFKHAIKKEKPDLIIVVQPSFFCAPAALLTAKLRGIHTLLHIQDYELDAMLELSSRGSTSTQFFREQLFSFERFILKKFSHISTISNSMVKKAIRKGIDKDKVFLFPNPSDVNFIKPPSKTSNFIKEWDLEGKFICLYSGNIGTKQGLEIIPQIAKQLEPFNVHFVIVGEGAFKKDLISLSSELSNITFKPLQEYEQLPELLAMANVHLVIQKKGVEGLLLPSKLTNILAIGGHAIVATAPGEELFELTKKHPGIYTPIQPEEPAQLIEAIKQAIQENLTPLRYNSTARKYAEIFIDQDMVMRDFEHRLESLITHKTYRKKQ